MIIKTKLLYKIIIFFSFVFYSIESNSKGLNCGLYGEVKIGLRPKFEHNFYQDEQANYPLKFDFTKNFSHFTLKWLLLPLFP